MVDVNRIRDTMRQVEDRRGYNGEDGKENGRRERGELLE